MNNEQRLAEALTGMVEREKRTVIQPMLTDRIVRRAREQGVLQTAARASVSVGIVGWARPLVLASLLVLAVLVAYNFRLSTGIPGVASTTDRVFGLPSVTVAVAFDPDFEDH